MNNTTNPTLIAGFEDVMTYIKNQDQMMKKLQEENKKLQEERDKYFGYFKEKDLECETQREYKEELQDKFT